MLVRDFGLLDFGVLIAKIPTPKIQSWACKDSWAIVGPLSLIIFINRRSTTIGPIGGPSHNHGAHQPCRNGITTPSIKAISP
jgi:hypothetical protein